MTDTAVDVEQLLLFFVLNVHFYPPTPPPCDIPASPEGLRRHLPWWHRRDRLPSPPWGTVDSREPSRLVFSVRKIQVSWLILKMVTGKKRSADWLLLWSQGGRRSFKRRKKSPSPLAPAHISLLLTGLPGFRVQAPIFSVGRNQWEHFFYIGNFKTIITLCVKNVQRNL